MSAGDTRTAYQPATIKYHPHGRVQVTINTNVPYTPT